MIAAVGTLGFIGCGLFAYYFGERLKRKYWLPNCAVLTLIGGIRIAVAGKPSAPTLNGTVIVAFIGSIILFFGFNVWAPITYACAVIPSLTGQPNGTLYAFLVIGAFLVVAAALAHFGIPTRSQKLDRMSP